MTKKAAFFMLGSILFLLIHFRSAAQGNEEQLSPEALQAKVFDLEGEEYTLKGILEQFPGQPIFIDLWASWCRDCIVGFPKIKEYQKKYPDVGFVYLSVDKKEDEWKRGIERFDLEGAHFRLDEGWNSVFCESVELDWIPRYMVMNSEGRILHYKSIKADDKALQKIIRLNQ
ncbi:MAG: TlpA disulfide reductase family protein [Cyclobacteriaceae bacterium]